MPLPNNYAERVYAGVLGKIIGVYLGRPFEGWRYERILAELGEVNYYVHEKLGRPLIVTDDDISGTYGGNCHVVPNHALIVLGLLYGDDDFQKSLMIANTSGWDTDCNSGNLGCLLGIKDGLAGIDAGPDWRGPRVPLAPGARAPLRWQIERQAGPVAEVGIELSSARGASGTVYLDYLTWAGEPDVTLGRSGVAGRRAWINAVDQNSPHDDEAFRPIQNAGRGLLIQGTRDWRDYQVSADVTPHLATAAGLAARVQGLRRYYALLRVPGALRLVKVLDDERTLAEIPFHWTFGERHQLTLEVVKDRLQASVDGAVVISVEDSDRPLRDGAVALVVEEGRTATRTVQIRPAG